MNLAPQEIADIIETISALDGPCVFEMALAVAPGYDAAWGMSCIRELADRGIIIMMYGDSHQLLVDIHPCNVCDWRYLRSRQQHEPWYKSHTTSYRHLYMAGPA